MNTIIEIIVKVTCFVARIESKLTSRFKRIEFIPKDEQIGFMYDYHDKRIRQFYKK